MGWNDNKQYGRRNHYWGKWSKWSGSWYKTASEREKIYCKDCHRFVYADRLWKVGGKCLCGAHFQCGGRERGLGNAGNANGGANGATGGDQQPQPLDPELQRILDKLSGQDTPVAKEVKTYLDAAKGTARLATPAAKSDSTRVQQASARVSKAQQQFDKAKKAMLRLTEEIAKQQVALDKAAEELAEAECDRTRVFKEFLPDNSKKDSEPVQQPKAILDVAKILEGQFDFELAMGDTFADAHATDEDRAEWDKRSAELIQSIKADLNKAFGEAVGNAKSRKEQMRDLVERFAKKRKSTEGAVGVPSAPERPDGGPAKDEAASSQQAATGEATAAAAAAAAASEEEKKRLEEDLRKKKEAVEKEAEEKLQALRRKKQG